MAARSRGRGRCFPDRRTNYRSRSPRLWVLDSDHRLTVVRQFADHAGTADAGGIGLVGVKVKFQAEIGRHPHTDIAESKVAALTVDVYRHFVPVFHAEAAGVLRA